jgi:L-fuculose-phosphate aldolase
VAAHTPDASLRRELIRACRRLDAKGHLAGAEGNLSAWLGPGRLIVTPAGRCKADLSAADLIATDMAGRPARPGAIPSSEMAMHVAIYRARPDVRAVVHAHPVAATAFAAAGTSFPEDVLAEVAGVIGPVPSVPYRAPGTGALATAVASALEGANVALLVSHGAVAVGPTVAVALQRMESLEQAARIIVAARVLGTVGKLKAAELRALRHAWRAGAGRGLVLRPARSRRN